MPALTPLDPHFLKQYALAIDNSDMFTGIIDLLNIARNKVK